MSLWRKLGEWAAFSVLAFVLGLASEQPGTPEWAATARTFLIGAGAAWLIGRHRDSGGGKDGRP